MKNHNANWCEVRADGRILIFRLPLMWRSFFAVLGSVFTAIALYSAYLLYQVPSLSGNGIQASLITLLILFGLLALPFLYFALPYRLQLDFARQAYETQHGLYVSHGSFTDIENSYVQRITMSNGYWYRVRLTWKRPQVRWSPILSETRDLDDMEGFARELAERLEVPFIGVIQ